MLKITFLVFAASVFNLNLHITYFIGLTGATHWVSFSSWTCLNLWFETSSWWMVSTLWHNKSQDIRVFYSHSVHKKVRLFTSPHSTRTLKIATRLIELNWYQFRHGAKLRLVISLLFTGLYYVKCFKYHLKLFFVFQMPLLPIILHEIHSLIESSVDVQQLFQAWVAFSLYW